MSDLFATAPEKRFNPADHFCLICERVASFGVQLRALPLRAGGAWPGDGFGGCAWYCSEHRHIGAALLARERSA